VLISVLAGTLVLGCSGGVGPSGGCSRDRQHQPDARPPVPFGQPQQFFIRTSTVSSLPADSRPTVPGGIHPRYPFFLPVHVLSRVFRGKFVAGLKRRFQQHQLTFAGTLQPLAKEKAFRSFLRPLFRQDWVVYARPPFGGPHHGLGYLARYTHRVAITNHRLVAFEHDQVTFRWKDYAHGNKNRMMTLGSQEFLRRFLLHVLPRGFVRIRSFGFLANRRRTTLLPLYQRLLANQPLPPPPTATTSSPTQPTCFRCPKCSTPMVIVERLSVLMAWQLTTSSAFLDSS
jgi:Putative transposase